VTTSKSNLVKWIIALAVFAIIAFIVPPPAELGRDAMFVLGVLVWFILAVSINLIPDYLAAFIGMLALSFSGVSTFAAVFGGFSSTTNILLMGAFGIGGVLTTCGVLQRVAKIICSKFPDTFAGRVTALFISGLVISPLMPSGSAKGIIMSMVSTPMAKQMGYKPKSRAGTGLFIAGWVPVGVLGVCFLSGCVSATLVSGQTDALYLAEFAWMNWLRNSAVFGIVTLVLCYIATLIIYKPRPEDIDEALKSQYAETADEDIAMTLMQKLALGVVVLTIILWMFSKTLGLADAAISLAGFSVLLLLNVIDRKKALQPNIVAWNIVIFSAFILGISSVMSQVGITGWMTGILTNYLAPVMNNFVLFTILLSVGVYLIRTIIVSQTLVTSALYIVLMPVGLAAGIHPWIIGFLCSMSIVTWNTLPSSIPFFSAYGAADGGDYPSFAESVKMSFVVMVVQVVACIASIPFWKLLGLM